MESFPESGASVVFPFVLPPTSSTACGPYVEVAHFLVQAPRVQTAVLEMLRGVGLQDFRHVRKSLQNLLLRTRVNIGPCIVKYGVRNV